MNFKVQVFDVVLRVQASDLKFHLATIDDKIYDMEAARVFNLLGPNVPKAFQRLQDKFLGIHSKQHVRTCPPERHIHARNTQKFNTQPSRLKSSLCYESTVTSQIKVGQSKSSPQKSSWSWPQENRKTKIPCQEVRPSFSRTRTTHE